MEKIAFVTDIHLDEQYPQEVGVNAQSNWDWILKNIKSRNIDQLIFGGDIGEPTAHERFFESLKGFNLKVILGNHDTFIETTQHYKPQAEFGKSGLYYFFEDDFFKFIFLDSSTEEINMTQFNWFKEQLDTTKEILIFIHHPVLPVNVIVDKLYPLKNRNQIKEELLKSKSNVTIFCGHYHMDDKTIEANITQLITPAASYQIEKHPEDLKTNSTSFGYRIITINKNKITSELVINE